MTTGEVTLEQRRQIREFQKTKQFEFCENLITRLDEMLVDGWRNGASSNLTVMMLLDALGIEGLSLTIGEDASNTFIKHCVYPPPYAD